jgi:hypothetical protein
MTCRGSRFGVRVAVTLIAATIATALPAREEPVRFGGSYNAVDARRQRYVDDWVGRFSRATGQQLQPASVYDDALRLSTKTTFEAITHALMTVSSACTCA